MRKSGGHSTLLIIVAFLGIVLTLWMLFGPDSTSTSGGATVSGCKVTHTVVAGDDLSHLASRYGTSIGALANANGITNPNLIRVGQLLCVAPQNAALLSVQLNNQDQPPAIRRGLVRCTFLYNLPFDSSSIIILLQVLALFIFVPKNGFCAAMLFIDLPDFLAFMDRLAAQNQTNQSGRKGRLR